MAIVTRATFKGVKPNIKTFLLNEGYTGKGEQEFDAIPHGYPDFLAARGEEDRWGGGWHLMPAPVVAQKLSTVARVRPGFHPGYVLEGTRQ